MENCKERVTMEVTLDFIGEITYPEREIGRKREKYDYYYRDGDIDHMK